MSTILARDDDDGPSNQPNNVCADCPSTNTGISDFRAYEDAVLPLLPEYSGRLERRLRNPDGTIEMHIISFASDTDVQNYRNDPRRTAQAWLLEKSSAKLELLPMANVS
jgi:hypothetical protein